MARPKKEDSPEGTTNIDVSKNLLGSLLNGYKEDHFNFVECPRYRIPSGSLILDSLCNVMTGQVVRISGAGAELGKSSQSLLFAENYMKTVPKSKTLFVMAEGRLSEELKKRTGQRYVYSAEEWEYGTIFVLKCNVYETVCQIIETLVKNMYEAGEGLCVIVDSLDGMMLKNDLQSKEFGANVKVAGVPLLTKLFFKRMALPIEAYNAFLIFTTQYSAEIKLDPYSKEPPRQVAGSGGSSITHQNSYTFHYHPRYGGDLILENEGEKPDPIKNKTLGVWSTLEIKKSATDVSGTKIKIPIARNRVGSAIWIEKEIGDLIIQWEMVKKGGAWLSFTDEIILDAKDNSVELQPKIQGINNLYDYLEKNKDICNYFHNKFKQTITA